MKDWLAAVGWWAVTILLLVLLDDLTYGPFFWVLGLAAGWIAAVVAFAVYFAAQIYLVFEGTKPKPSRPAAAILKRLRLTRRSEEVGLRELRIHERVTGGLAAVLLSVVIGGVLPPLILWRRGWARQGVLRLSVLTSAVYATEFALLHGYAPTRVL